MDRVSHLISTDSTVFDFLPWISIKEIVVVINSILSTNQKHLQRIPGIYSKTEDNITALKISTTPKNQYQLEEKAFMKILLRHMENKFLDFLLVLRKSRRKTFRRRFFSPAF